jgi:predicted amidophosphoribosyltransferase
MPTSDVSWSARLRVVGDLERPDHFYLTEQDRCAFFGEYTARAGHGHSSTNQLIHNLKKKPETRGTAQWKYKASAIREIGSALAANIDPRAFATTVFVPIPPSKTPGSPGYDDRVTQVARAMGTGVDVREVLNTMSERNAMHVNQNTRDPDALRATIGIRTPLLANSPAQVVLLDDVLTAGCSFKVCKGILQEVWPKAEIYGIFVARRVIERLSLFGSGSV